MKSEQHERHEQPESLESDLPKLSAPALRALNEAGYVRPAQLAEVTEAEIKKLHGMGPNGLKQLRDALNAKGLSFASGKKK